MSNDSAVEYFKIYCEEVARSMAKNRTPPNKIPEKLSRNSHLMKILGIKKRGQGVKFSRKGMIHRLGQALCDEIMDSKLIETGVYEKDGEIWRFSRGSQEEAQEDRPAADS